MNTKFLEALTLIYSQVNFTRIINTEVDIRTHLLNLCFTREPLGQALEVSSNDSSNSILDPVQIKGGGMGVYSSI